MSNLTSTVITHSDVLNDVVLNHITCPDGREEYIADISGAQGEIYLLVDAEESTATITVTLLGGEDPVTAGSDASYTVPRGGCKLIVFSGGERICKDGMLRFTLQSSTALNTQGLRIAVIKRRNVESH